MKFTILRAPYCSKILCFTNGDKTNEYLMGKIGTSIDGYEFVDYKDYEYCSDIG